MGLPEEHLEIRRKERGSLFPKFTKVVAILTPQRATMITMSSYDVIQTVRGERNDYDVIQTVRGELNDYDVIQTVKGVGIKLISVVGNRKPRRSEALSESRS